MDDHETLPSLEKKSSSENLESQLADQKANQDSDHESVANRASERDEPKSQAAQTGSGVMTASDVDDAQSQVQGATGDDNDSTNSSDSPTDLDVPQIAEDIDLIEKEWVRKAKDIVNATYGDPYTQNKQISKMKVEYIKKRYNKEIKLRED